MEVYKSVSLIFLAVVVFSYCEAAVPKEGRSACKDMETGKSYALGEIWYTDSSRHCMSLTCEEEGSISGIPCAPFVLPHWCQEHPGDPKAVYPGCCPYPVCPDDNAIEGSSSSSGYYGSVYFGVFPYPPAQ